MKKCTRCLESKPKTDFCEEKRWRIDGLQSWCKSCASKSTASWCKRNPERARELQLKAKYNITIEEYDALFMSQGGLCVICHTPEPGGRGRFHVDHNHETGKVRSLLCARCNTGIGQFKENPDTMRAAADYVEYHKAVENA